MAKSKSEHVDIRVSKPVRDKPTESQVSGKLDKEQITEEESVEKDGGFSRAMHSPGKSIKPKSAQAQTDSEKGQEKEQEAKRPSSSEEGTTEGNKEFATEQPKTEGGKSEGQEQEKDPESEQKAASESTPTKVEENLPEETNEESDIYDDFYTSKLNADQQTPKKPQKPQKANLDHSSSSKHALISARFWFLFFIFVITLLAGFVMLYQLEQAQSGAGIIFDWFEWL